MEQSTNNMTGVAERKEMGRGRKGGTNNVKVCVQVWFNEFQQPIEQRKTLLRHSSCLKNEHNAN